MRCGRSFSLGHFIGVMFLLLSFFISCSSTPPVIPEGLTPMQFFQRAQEESDNYRWDNALLYYKTFLERYPNDLPNVLAARYEIAFILYKKEQYAESKKLFEELLDTYKKFDNPLAVPQWPKVLAEKVLRKIQERTAPQGKSPPN
jgi:outer membrane protein assembly factor BamD (BamD/ComL family)